jgi:hypothetical protein
MVIQWDWLFILQHGWIYHRKFSDLEKKVDYIMVGYKLPDGSQKNLRQPAWEIVGKHQSDQYHHEQKAHGDGQG